MFMFLFSANCEYIKQVLKPFDWTFTTDYKGTVFAKDEQHTINVSTYSILVLLLINLNVKSGQYTMGAY